MRVLQAHPVIRQGHNNRGPNNSSHDCVVEIQRRPLRRPSHEPLKSQVDLQRERILWLSSLVHSLPPVRVGLAFFGRRGRLRLTLLLLRGRLRLLGQGLR